MVVLVIHNVIIYNLYAQVDLFQKIDFSDVFFKELITCLRGSPLSTLGGILLFHEKKKKHLETCNLESTSIISTRFYTSGAGLF